MTTYRGEDLDLRSPLGRPPRDTGGSAEPAMNGTRPRMPATNGSRNEPLYVDDTVLACCNHAYDIAQAHGAAEVRLEHLVHALTRVEAAAEVLEQRGIREAHLRRESAAVIASEIPVGLAHSHAAPRSSVELEDVLRRASEQARRRDNTASVQDLLWVLLNYDREIPAIALLLRHATDWQSWDWPHQSEQRSPPRTQSYYGDRRPYDTPAPPPPRSRPVEQPVQTVNYDRPASGDLDAVFGRLDQMDSALRRFQSDMANDRRALTDLLRDVQRDIASNRGSGGGNIPAALVDRMQGIEHAVEARFDEFNRTAGTLTDRLQGLEKAVSSGMQEGARNWSAMGDRLKMIDKIVGQNPNAGLGELITEQLISVTSQVQAATEKLQTLEKGIEARQGDSQRAWTTVSERLKAIEEGLRSGAGSNGTSLAPMQSLLNDRFQAIRQQLEQQNLSTASLVAQMTEPVTDRLRQVESLLQRTGDTSQTDRVMLERLAKVEQMVGGTVTQSNAEMETLATRFGQIETLVTSHGDRAVQYTQQVAQQTANAHTRELSDLQEAIVQLGTNQQTLSENLDQWRTESEGGVSIISNRLAAMETAAQAPTALLKQMQSDMEGIQRVTLADYDQNRKGILNWLFGTEDLFAGSWRDETRQIRDRLKQMREDRKA